MHDEVRVRFSGFAYVYSVIYCDIRKRDYENHIGGNDRFRETDLVRTKPCSVRQSLWFAAYVLFLLAEEEAHLYELSQSQWHLIQQMILVTDV